MHRPSYHSGELRPLQPEPFLVISQGLYLCDGTLSYLVLYTAIKSQMYWFTCLSTPPAMTTNVKSILILQSVQSNISLLMMGWKKKAIWEKKIFFTRVLFSFLSLPNSPKSYLTPLCQSAGSRERAPDTDTHSEQALQNPHEAVFKINFPILG